jgi:tetratricopeptide (TPR) repeat protein
MTYADARGNRSGEEDAASSNGALPVDLARISRSRRVAAFRGLVFLRAACFVAFVFLVGAVGAVAVGGKPSAAGQSSADAVPAALPFRVQPNDSTTREGFEAFYNMDYDRAITLFEQERDHFPNDPFVVNHLLAAVLAKELNREGQLDATLYMGNKFLELKEPPVDPEVKARIDQLSLRALSLANQELAKNPKDTDALFARAVGRGLATVYSAVIEKRWVGALREGLGAYHDDEHVLKLDPNYSDAKLVVGTFQYIVGSLSWWEKSLAFVADMRGNKAKGLLLLGQAVAGGGEESIDASSILALFLAREGRYDEALTLLQKDYTNFPHNFIFGLAVADLLNAAGKHQEAIAAYRKLVALGKQGFFPGARVERADYSLGQVLRGEKNYAAAAAAFNEAINYPRANPGIVAPAALEEGEVYDLLGQREKAVQCYQQAQSIAPQGSQTARSAAQFLKHPYVAPAS